MSIPNSIPNHLEIEVRGFKWPRRPTATAIAYLLGDDEFGRWLGVAQGSPWRDADGAASGVFVASFVKLVPRDTFWTACFNLGDPVVDVDIVLPVRWTDNVLEEVDLELDVLRFADGSVHVRDRDAFDRVRVMRAMPDEIAARAEETCAQVRALVAQGAEPFGRVGRAWLRHFLAEADGKIS
jgi:uncharacterized protein